MDDLISRIQELYGKTINVARDQKKSYGMDRGASMG